MAGRGVLVEGAEPAQEGRDTDTVGDPDPPIGAAGAVEATVGSADDRGHAGLEEVRMRVESSPRALMVKRRRCSWSALEMAAEEPVGSGQHPPRGGALCHAVGGAGQLRPIQGGMVRQRGAIAHTASVNSPGR
jgi:hypothetical protein